jgi:hypothetical protein
MSKIETVAAFGLCAGTDARQATMRFVAIDIDDGIKSVETEAKKFT